MASFLRDMFTRVVQRGGGAAAEAAPARTGPSGLPPMTKVRPPTLDGRAPQGPGDIDPALLAELYKLGPALKTETEQPMRPETDEEASRKARFGKLREKEPPPEGRLVEADIIHFLNWRESRERPDAATFAKALGGGEEAERVAAALCRDFGHPQIQDAKGGLRIGLWGPSSVAGGVIDSARATNAPSAAPRPPAPQRILPGRRPRGSV